MVSRKGPSLRFVDDRSLIEVLAETDRKEFDEKLNQLTGPKSALNVSSASEEQINVVESKSEQTGNICNNLAWCSLSTSRFLSQASNYRPCSLNFSFHIAAITHRMLNVYENEEETDLHDFLTNEDLVIMNRHQSDEDQKFTLIFQPKYKIRPDSKKIVQKLNTFIDTENMRSSINISEDSDFFVDAWQKSNPFHDISMKEKPTTSKKTKKTKKH